MKIKDINKYESTYYSIKCSINMSHCLPHLPFHGACWLKTFWADLVGVQKPLGPYIFLSMQIFLFHIHNILVDKNRSNILSF